MNPKDVGSIILARRLEKNISQAYLAEKCSCVQSTIARIESGKRTPSLVMLDTIGRVLEVNLIALFGDVHKTKALSATPHGLVEEMQQFVVNAGQIIEQLSERNKRLEEEVRAIKDKLGME